MKMLTHTPLRQCSKEFHVCRNARDYHPKQTAAVDSRCRLHPSRSQFRALFTWLENNNLSFSFLGPSTLSRSAMSRKQLNRVSVFVLPQLLPSSARTGCQATCPPQCKRASALVSPPLPRSPPPPPHPPRSAVTVQHLLSMSSSLKDGFNNAWNRRVALTA
jgi:hypothetical protein